MSAARDMASGVVRKRRVEGPLSMSEAVKRMGEKRKDIQGFADEWLAQIPRNPPIEQKTDYRRVQARSQQYVNEDRIATARKLASSPQPKRRPGPTRPSGSY